MVGKSRLGMRHMGWNCISKKMLFSLPAASARVLQSGSLAGQSHARALVAQPSPPAGRWGWGLLAYTHS